MVLARAIADISLQNVPNYATPDLHGVPGDDGGDQAERPVLMGVKGDGKVAHWMVTETSSEGSQFRLKAFVNTRLPV